MDTLRYMVDYMREIVNGVYTQMYDAQTRLEIPLAREDVVPRAEVEEAGRLLPDPPDVGMPETGGVNPRACVPETTSITYELVLNSRTADM